MTHDYSAHQQKMATDEEIKGLGELVSNLQDEIQTLELCELDVKRAKTRVRHLAEEVIPNRMTELGCKEHVLLNGFKVELGTTYDIGITVDNREAAYQWMDENGHGGLIKRDITIHFNRDQQDDARKLQKELQSRKFPDVSEKASIHHSTLGSWGRKRLEAGEFMPPSITATRRPIVKVAKTK